MQNEIPAILPTHLFDNKEGKESFELKSKNNYRKFLKAYIFIFIFFLIPIYLNYLFLRNCGEFLSTKQIFESQNKVGEFNIYGSSIFNDISELKLYSYKYKKPKIISFGSSRVLQFREQFFSKSFYNMGYTATSIHEALNATAAMLTAHRPQVVLLGIDFWWFNENFQKSDAYDLCSQRAVNKIDPAHLLLPFKWIKDEKITISDYMRLFTLSKTHHIGVGGKLRKSGISADGSCYYTDLVTGHSNNFGDVSFKETADSVAKGTGRFTHGTSFSEIHFQKFLDLLEIFQKNNVKVILFFPPLAPEINKLMKQYDYSYIAELRGKLKKNDVKVYDFTDPNQLLSTNDGEFIDGFHGGDVIYARMLNYIVSREASLKNYVSKDYLEKVICKYAGLAMIPDPRITSEKEVDFLRIGGTKNSN